MEEQIVTSADQQGTIIKAILFLIYILLNFARLQWCNLKILNICLLLEDK
jgi:hypothetical protein